MYTGSGSSRLCRLCRGRLCPGCAAGADAPPLAKADLPLLCTYNNELSLEDVFLNLVGDTHNELTMIFFCPGMTSCEQKKNLKEWLNHSEIALAGRKDSDFEF